MAIPENDTYYGNQSIVTYESYVEKFGEFVFSHVGNENVEQTHNKKC